MPKRFSKQMCILVDISLYLWKVNVIRMILLTADSACMERTLVMLEEYSSMLLRSDMSFDQAPLISIS
jgi:hypothetical protein